MSDPSELSWPPAPAHTVGSGLRAAASADVIYQKKHLCRGRRSAANRTSHPGTLAAACQHTRDASRVIGRSTRWICSSLIKNRTLVSFIALWERLIIIHALIDVFFSASPNDLSNGASWIVILLSSNFTPHLFSPCRLSSLRRITPSDLPPQSTPCSMK